MYSIFYITTLWILNPKRKAYIDTLLDGGYTHLVDGTINPTEGYIVGGVTEPTTMYAEVDGSAYPDVSAHFEGFKKLWNKYEMLLPEYTSNLYEAGMGVGTWVHEGQIYFDLVQHLYNLDVATKLAKEHGEIAIYDCKNQKDILL